MNRKWLLLLPFLFLPFIGHAQVVGPGFVDYVTSAPSGSCSQNAHQRNVMGLGTVYTCQSGTWAQISGGGGGCAQGTCVVNAPTSDQTITGAHALILSDVGSSFWEKAAGGFGSQAVPGGTNPNIGGIPFPGGGVNTNVTRLDVEEKYSAAGDASAVHFPIVSGLDLNYPVDDAAGDLNTAILSESLTDVASSHNIHELNGYFSEVDHNGSGTITTVQGVNAQVFNDNAGTITTLRALSATIGNFGAGTVATGEGVFIASPFIQAGTMTHSYGIFMQDQTATAGGTNPDPHSIFIQGSAPNNLGSGLTTVGSLTSTGTVTAPTYATTAANGGITGTEGTGAGLTAGSSIDLLWPDSTAHRWKMNNNNGGAVNVLGTGDPLNVLGNPTANTTFTFPATNVLLLNGTAPASVSGAGTAAGILFTVTAPAGGATTGSATTGGTGGDAAITTGVGGSGAGGTNANGGRGGNFTLTLGAGGAKQGSGVVGATGHFTMTGGQLFADNGTCAAPSYGFTTNSGNVGMFYDGTLLGLCQSNGGGWLGIGSTGLQIRQNDALGWSSSTTFDAAANTLNLTQKAAGVMYVGTTAASIQRTGFILSADSVFVTGNFTTAANTNLQTITGLSWTVPATAINYNFHCHGSYSQATGAAAVAFGIQAATNNPTNIYAQGTEQITAGPPATFVTGTLATLATTTATTIVSGTPGAQGTNYTFDLAGTLENAASANTYNIMVSTATSGDAVTVLRGSYCAITP